MATFGGVIGGCVLADPPPTLPVVAESAPIIENDAAFPPWGQLIVTWPTRFIVPIQVFDPTETLYYEAFYDYSSLPGAPQGFLQEGDAGSGASGSGVLDVPITLPQPLLPGCHVVEIVMAFGGRFPSHDPGPGLGSSIYWFYNPAGDVASCPLPDAGWFQDGSLPDVTEAAAVKMDGGA